MATENKERKGSGRNNDRRRGDKNDSGFREEVISLNRCAKVVKGGRRFSFSALVCVGDGKSKVGLGFGKANEVPDAITKAIEAAKRSMKTIPLIKNTLPHEIMGQFGTARVWMKPASEGTGLIAGSHARKVLELAGVHDVLAKSLGSDNAVNVAKATLQGLLDLSRADHIARLRGKEINEILGKKMGKIHAESLAKIDGVVPEKKEKAAEKSGEAKGPKPEQLEDEAPAVKAAPEAAAGGETEKQD